MSDKEVMEEIPRRIRIDLMCPAELSIREAVLKVEEAGADELLTDAVILLGEAQNKVADFVDGKKKRLEKTLNRLKEYRLKIDKMTSCHVISHPVSDHQPDGKVSFDKTEEGITQGADAPGDLSGGFELIKEGLLKDLDFDIEDLEKQLEEK